MKTLMIDRTYYSRRLVALFLVVLVSVVGIAALVTNQLTQPAAAATPPDTCFAFSGGTITDYYDNEGNDGNNPACPREVDIPAQINGEAVTTIGGNAFSGLNKNNPLTSVTIPNTVTTIGYNAFQGNQLTAITIPNSVTSIEYGAFSLNRLTSVAIPNSVTSIGSEAFASNQLTSVTIPNTVTTIESGTFGNNQLTSIAIPNSVTSIGRNAFASNQLTAITIPSSVTTIDDQAFFDNLLTSVTIPASVTSLGSSAFSYNRIHTVMIEGNPTFDTGAYGAFSNQGISSICVPPPVPSFAPAPRAAAAEPGCDLSTVIVTSIFTPNMPNPPESQLHREKDYESMDPDVDGDGSTQGIVSVQLINPASLTINYRNTAGETLKKSVTYYGRGIADRFATTLAAKYPNATSADLANIYFFAGSTVTFQPPAIDGYDTPPEQRYTFKTSGNVQAQSTTVVYQRSSDSGSGSGSGGNNGSGSNNGNNNGGNAGTDAPRSGGLAETGVNIYGVLAMILGGGALLGAVAAIVRRK